jgi:hypothetical protein
MDPDQVCQDRIEGGPGVEFFSRKSCHGEKQVEEQTSSRGSRKRSQRRRLRRSYRGVCGGRVADGRGGKGLESTAGSASRAAATFERKLTDAVWRQRAKWWRRGWDPVVRPGENAESTGELKT